MIRKIKMVLDIIADILDGDYGNTPSEIIEPEGCHIIFIN